MRHYFGTVYDLPGKERYILAQVDYEVASLINLRDGNRFNDPKKITLNYGLDEKIDCCPYITEPDFVRVAGYENRNFFKKVKKQAI